MAGSAAYAAFRRRKKLLAKKERLIKAEIERKAARQAKCDELFASADKDHSGTLDANEARTLVQSLLGEETELTDHIYLQVVAYATTKYPGSLDSSISKSGRILEFSCKAGTPPPPPSPGGMRWTPSIAGVFSYHLGPSCAFL